MSKELANKLKPIMSAMDLYKYKDEIIKALEGGSKKKKSAPEE